MAMKGQGIHQTEMDLSWGRINFYMFRCVIGVNVCEKDHKGWPCHLSTSLLRVLPAN